MVRALNGPKNRKVFLNEKITKYLPWPTIEQTSKKQWVFGEKCIEI